MNALTASASVEGAEDIQAKDFRWLLRARTADRHARLDSLISSLDLTRRADLERFFRVHLMSFIAMARHYPDTALREMIGSLRGDLDALGAEGGDKDTLDMRPFHPLAARYILAGSRLGTVVLRRDWMRSEDTQVLAADRYFTSTPDRDEWPAVCAELSAVTVDSDLAETISGDAEAIFDAFARAFSFTERPSKRG